MNKIQRLEKLLKEYKILLREEAARPINVIAQEISQNWKPVNYAAKPYLEAMFSLDKITDSYGQDSGRSVVAYFLSNARSWKGDVATRVKAELNKMLKSR